MRELVTATRHGLAGFLMIVVGQAGFPEGLHVSLHSGKEWRRLSVNEEEAGAGAESGATVQNTAASEQVAAIAPAKGKGGL